MNKPKFANILFDETFKIVVCAPGNEPLLIRLIETLIPGKKIRSLERLDKENHGLVISDKNTTFDLFCTSEAGEQFIVEMQFAEQETYRERMLFYATYPLRAQMDARIRAVERLSGITRDRMDYSLHPVYVLSMLNFSLPHEGDEALEEGLVSRFSIRNDGNGEIMTDALHFIYLELGRLGRKKGEEALCRTPLERLAYSLKYMHMLDERPNGFDDDLQQMLFTATELAGMTQEQRQEYDKTMTTKIDIIEQQETARKRGLEEGMEKGMEKGRLEGLLDVAGKMRAEGLPAELICRMTGLSPEQVKAL